MYCLYFYRAGHGFENGLGHRPKRHPKFAQNKPSKNILPTISDTYTVRKITSYNLYLCRLHRILCIDTDYNLQIIILIYPANMLCIQLKGWIDTAYQMYRYSIFSVSIQIVLLSSSYCFSKIEKINIKSQFLMREISSKWEIDVKCIYKCHFLVAFQLHLLHE